MKNPHCLFSVFILIFFLIHSTACKKQENPPELISQISELDDFSVKLLEKYKGVALSAAIIRGNQLLWSAGYGQANISANRKAEAETIYMIASVSKTVTGVAVMQLAEKGKINLDENINSYLPFQVVHPNHPGSFITCRHLLSHISGIRDDHLTKFAGELTSINQDPSLSLAEFCTGFFTPGNKFYNASTFSSQGPGKEYIYSNLGFALLGYIVERVAGVPFHQFTKDNIFVPLGMNQTSWRLAELPLEKLAMPYDENNQPFGHYTFADYPNGGLFTTVNDLSKFLRAFANGGAWNGARILTQMNVNEMLKIHYPAIAPYQGLAWGREAFYAAGKLWGHLGAERGVATLMFFDQNNQSGVIALMNKLPESEEKGFSLVQEILSNFLNVVVSAN